VIEDKTLDELLALAEKATPGERFWSRDDDGTVNSLLVKTEPYKIPGMGRTVFHDKLIIGATGLHTQGWMEIEEADQAFIAALDPATIRQLVQELKDWRISTPYMVPPLTAWKEHRVSITIPDREDTPEARAKLERLREHIETNVEAARLFDRHGPEEEKP
jgi:hypothetical protein